MIFQELGNGERFQQGQTYESYVELAEHSIDIMKKNIESNQRRYGRPPERPYDDEYQPGDNAAANA